MYLSHVCVQNTTTVVRSGEVASRLMNGKAFMYRTTCVPLDGKDDENTKEAKQILAKKLAVAKAIAVLYLLYLFDLWNG